MRAEAEVCSTLASRCPRRTPASSPQCVTSTSQGPGSCAGSAQQASSLERSKKSFPRWWGSVRAERVKSGDCLGSAGRIRETPPSRDSTDSCSQASSRACSPAPSRRCLTFRTLLAFRRSLLCATSCLQAWAVCRTAEAASRLVVTLSTFSAFSKTSSVSWSSSCLEAPL